MDTFPLKYRVLAQVVASGTDFLPHACKRVAIMSRTGKSLRRLFNIKGNVPVILPFVNRTIRIDIVIKLERNYTSLSFINIELRFSRSITFIRERNNF